MNFDLTRATNGYWREAFAPFFEKSNNEKELKEHSVYLTNIITDAFKRLQASDEPSDCSLAVVSVSVLSDKLKSMRYTKEQKDERSCDGLQEVFGWEICLNEIEGWIKTYCTEH